MYHQTFAWGNSKYKINYGDRWIDRLWILGLLIAALLLFGINLGELPLQDWHEGTVAQVAREIWRAPAHSLRWLYPTLGGEPYFNKPPLLHLLIAGAYSIGGVNEWTTRLPGAMLTAISVPLLYVIGREIFRSRRAAIFSALIYLTMLPVVRLGRLAMWDGAVLCFLLLMIWCVLRSRRDLRFALGAGIALGLICLTKGMMGFLLAAIAMLFLSWDTPRLLTSGYLWVGLLIGSAPVVFWYGMQWLNVERSQQFFRIGIWQQSLQRIWIPVENHGGPVWYYLLEIVKYMGPWLLFFPPGLWFAKENQNLSWAKLVLIWFTVYLVAISAMETKLPWYILPLYPAIALAGGAYLAEVYNWTHSRSYPRFWIISLSVMALIGFAGSLYFGGVGTKLDWQLHLVLMSVAITFAITAILIAQHDLQFISILFWGSYVSLLLFMSSPHWIWELNAAYPVKQVAAMVNKYTTSSQHIYTFFPYSRSSLNFYSDRQIIPIAQAENLKSQWQKDPDAYFLIEQEKLKQLNLTDVKKLASVSTIAPKSKVWTLIKRSSPLDEL